jgi:hypothetical protein
VRNTIRRAFSINQQGCFKQGEMLVFPHIGAGENNYSVRKGHNVYWAVHQVNSAKPMPPKTFIKRALNLRVHLARSLKRKLIRTVIDLIDMRKNKNISYKKKKNYFVVIFLFE